MNFFKEIIIWTIFASFAFAIWQRLKCRHGHARKQAGRKSSSGKWYLPDTKTALLIAGWLMFMAYPTVITVVFIVYLAMLLLVFILGVFLYLISKITDGWSVKLEK